MLFVISPSKTQTLACPVGNNQSLPVFTHLAAQLVARLQQYDRAGLAVLLKISDKLAVMNYQRFQQFELPFTVENSRPALLMFQGDQYTPMAAENYDNEQWAHAQRHLRILSGLYGMLRPLDLIQPYRLEMATRLAVGNVENLYKFWRESITSEINSLLQADANPLLVNLASAEYFKVIERKKLQADVLTLSFKQHKEGKLKTIAIYAKRARGALMNFVISNRITEPDDLRGFSVDGYRFAPDLSSWEEWFFVRKLL